MRFILSFIYLSFIIYNRQISFNKIAYYRVFDSERVLKTHVQLVDTCNNKIINIYIYNNIKYILCYSIILLLLYYYIYIILFIFIVLLFYIIIYVYIQYKYNINIYIHICKCKKLPDSNSKYNFPGILLVHCNSLKPTWLKPIEFTKLFVN